MGILTYQVNIDDLDEDFIEALKILFRDAKIIISVQEVNTSKESEANLPEKVNDKRK